MKPVPGISLALAAPPPWLPACLLICLLAGGCDRARRAYDLLPLGPSFGGYDLKLPPETQRCSVGLAFGELGRPLFPLGAQHRRMVCLLDDRQVIARLYQNGENSWGILVVGTAAELVAEVRIPPEWFGEPNEQWDSEKELTRCMRRAGRITDLIVPLRPFDSDPDACPSAREALAFILDEPEADDEPAAGRPARARHAGRYLAACLALLDGLRDNVNSASARELFDGLFAKPGVFRGITEEGYSQQWRRDLAGEGWHVEYTIRNLGDRRVRMGIKEAGLFFPLSYFGYWGYLMEVLTGYAPHGTRVTEVDVGPWSSASWEAYSYPTTQPDEP